jgi:hypothetical protein
MGAAFVNAISANLLDFDDTHPETIIHPAAPVAAAALALAEAHKLSGRDVLTAFILEWNRVPDRQRRLSATLRARLAHHIDLRDIRRGGGLR